MLSPNKLAPTAAQPSLTPAAAAAHVVARPHCAAARPLHLARAAPVPTPQHHHSHQQQHHQQQQQQQKQQGQPAPAPPSASKLPAPHSPGMGQAGDQRRASADGDAAHGPPPDSYTGPPRVPAAEDAPLSLAWVRGLPVAAAGPEEGRVGRISVVMGPMFAGKSTALLDAVGGGQRASGLVVGEGRVEARVAGAERPMEAAPADGCSAANRPSSAPSLAVPPSLEGGGARGRWPPRRAGQERCRHPLRARVGGDTQRPARALLHSADARGLSAGARRAVGPIPREPLGGALGRSVLALGWGWHWGGVAWGGASPGH
jgi:hypothetical protein